MGVVVSPRAVTYSATCHQWFCLGASASRVLPTICIHMCSVSRVSRHSESGRLGHVMTRGYPDPLRSRISVARGRGGLMMPPTKLAHVVFQTNRLKEMSAWYCNVLGGHVIYENPHLCFVTYDE